MVEKFYPDRGIGYWIGNCPKNCKKVYSEFNFPPTFFAYFYIYSKNLRQGDFISFYENKTVAAKGFYKNGSEIGLSVTYYEDGSILDYCYDGVCMELSDIKKHIAKERLKNL